MKTPHAAGRSSKKARAAASPTVPLKVFIGYADLDAVRRATGTVIAAARDSRHEVELHPLLWRFEQLASSHWHDRAITAALEADLVVLASSTPAGISPTIDRWIASFLGSLHGRRTTLVVISGPSEAWTISIERPARRALAETTNATAREALVA